MKVRIKFSKTGALVYIGHLDVMRYFQKLFRRAQIPIAYSEGFSPHQILSFSHPLPLGMESYGEYADIELTEGVSSLEAIDRMRNESVPEIEILSFKQLEDRTENAMASVKAARYTVDLNGDKKLKDISDIIAKFLDYKEFIVTKVTKKTTKEEDLRPLVYECFINDAGLVEMLISSGSVNNVKPEVMLNALAKIADTQIDCNDYKICRIDQYTLIDDKLISLNDIGKDII